MPRTDPAIAKTTLLFLKIFPLGMLIENPSSLDDCESAPIITHSGPSMQAIVVKVLHLSTQLH